MFLEYIVTVMGYLYLNYTDLIEEWKQNLDVADYENNIYKDVKLPSTNNQLDTDYLMVKTKQFLP